MTKIKVSDIYEFNPDGVTNPLALFEDENGLFGYIDKKGNVVIPPMYDYASNFVQINGKLRAVVSAYNFFYERFYKLIDETGKNISAVYDEIKIIDDSIIVRKGSKYGLLDENGNNKEYLIFDNIRNEIGTIKYKKGKYKGLVSFYYLIDGKKVNARYGKPTSRCDYMATEYDCRYLNYPNQVDKYGNAYFDKFIVDSREAEVYVNLNTGQILEDYEVLTSFEKVKENTGEELRAIAIKKSNKEICLINQRGKALISYPFDKYTIEKIYNNKYLVINRENGFRYLYDMYGRKVIDCSVDINAQTCGLILVKDLNNITSICDENGFYIKSYVDYICINGEKNGKYYVANYIDGNTRKSELIDVLGNRIDFKIDYDETSEFINGYAVLSKRETDYSMNNPYEYNKQYIVTKDKRVIAGFPKDNVLDSFSYIGNYANDGFFIAKYENKEEFAILDLEGNIKFTIKCNDLEYKNGMFIAEANVFGIGTNYFFIDKNGYGIFGNKYFDNAYSDYKILSDDVILLCGDNGKLFITSDNGKEVTLDDFKSHEEYGTYNKYRYIVKNLGEELSTREKILSSVEANEYSNMEKFILLEKTLRRIKCPVDIRLMCTEETDINGNTYYSLIDEIKENLKYFDLSGISFDNVDVRGVDFSETNAKIDPFRVYNSNIDGCKLKRDNLVNFYSLKIFTDNDFLFDNNGLRRISMKGTIIDEIVADETGQKLILNRNYY